MQLNALVSLDSIISVLCLQKIHSSKGTLPQALPFVQKIEKVLIELVSAAAPSCGIDTGSQIPNRPPPSYTGVQQVSSPAAGRRGKASKAIASSMRAHQSRVGRGAAVADVQQWPLNLTVWRHRIKGLEAEHFFSLQCLGWTTEGGTLPLCWKRLFLDAMDLISNLLDQSGEVGVLLKPLRVSATTCLHGVRFLSATMRSLWAHMGNFSAYRWERRSSSSSVPHEFSAVSLVTPGDLQECIDRLHRVLAVSPRYPQITTLYTRSHWSGCGGSYKQEMFGVETLMQLVDILNICLSVAY